MRPLAAATTVVAAAADGDVQLVPASASAAVATGHQPSLRAPTTSRPSLAAGGPGPSANERAMWRLVHGTAGAVQAATAAVIAARTSSPVTPGSVPRCTSRGTQAPSQRTGTPEA